MSFDAEQISHLVDRVVEGDRRAVARAISICEDAGDGSSAGRLVEKLWPHTNDDTVTVGVTGPPGVGKSTLTSGLVRHLRDSGHSVGVIAVDPSSSVTQGALLGDRVRMSEHYLDQAVFIRSMSSRGHLGGISEATFLASAVLNAAGKDVTIIETVGVGQSEIDIRYLADSVIVVLQPASGDSIQAIKSGLMEIPDVLCLNKSDLPGAQRSYEELAHTLRMSSEDDRPPVNLVETTAQDKESVNALWGAVLSHRAELGAAGLKQQRRSHISHQLTTMVLRRTAPDFDQFMRTPAGQDMLDGLQSRALDPLTAIESILQANQ